VRLSNDAGTLTNRHFKYLFLGVIFRLALDHDVTRAGKRESASRIFGRRFHGRPVKKAGQVERREAQRPFSGLRKPVGSDAAPRERASQPRSSGAFPEPRQLRQGVSQTPGASRRSIRFLERKKGTGGPAPA
jgi:hypothetical protein